MDKKIKNNMMLLLAALIWGSAFVAQSIGMDHLGPFTFNSVRCFLGAFVLLPVIWFLDHREKRNGRVPVSGEEKKKERRTLLLGGLCCGLVLTAASSLQQTGIVYTTAGKAGFITALYILLVPVIGIFMGKKAGVKIWIGVALGVLGMYLLCMQEGASLAYGDLLVLLCAVAFSVHILVIDHFSPKVNGVKMSCIQFFVCGAISAVPALLLERPELSAILGAWIPIFYTGALSSGVAYTLQIVAQKEMKPTVASLIMSMESVFAVLTGWLVLGETLTLREFLGCAVMFAAIILAQLPDKHESPRQNEHGQRA